MIALHPNETIIRAAHRHWIVISGGMTIVALLLLIPSIGLLIMPLLPFPPELISLLYYFFSLYALIVAVLAFGMWMDYYLDIWIITNRRIIDVEHKGLFYREVSEFMLDRVQDVTIEKQNFLSLMLGYGNIRVHTAGEQSFEARDLPRVKEIKDIIMSQKTIT
ncbi:MAG: PH domain-containing protein [Candidatus Niyogibacteria bacterium]|nr:PH domain-containing protein [Candidatus Niyogibacteria bacterium]